MDQAVGMAEMFGCIKNENGAAVIANRSLETVFYNFFLTSDENQASDIYKAAVQDKNQFSNNLEPVGIETEHLEEEYGHV